MSLYLHSEQNSEDTYGKHDNHLLEEGANGIGDISASNIDPVIYDKQALDHKKETTVDQNTYTEYDDNEHLEDSQLPKRFHIRDTTETSPFKQAVKGFVLNKLSKKVASSNILYGITEKIVKKLEDSKDASPSIVVSPDTEINLSNLKVKESCNQLVAASVACELKSVVANDLMEASNVEEADECFEEPKSTISDTGISAKVKPSMSSISLPSSPAHQFVKRASVSTCSSLESIQQNQETSSPISSLHSRKKRNVSLDSSTLKQKDEIELQDLKNTVADSFTKESHKFRDYPSNIYPGVNEETTVFKYSVFDRFYLAYLYLKNMFYSLPVSHLFLLLTLIIHNLHFLSTYLAFVFDGIVIAYVCYSYICILIQRPIPNAAQKFPFVDPQRGNASVDVSKTNKSLKGCVKLLKGSYDPEVQKNYLFDIVDISIENHCLKVFYPKRRPSKEAVSGTDVCIMYDLVGAQISIVPKGLSKRRIWKKNYPICILLSQVSSKGNSVMVSDNLLVSDVASGADYLPLIPFEDVLIETPKPKALYIFAITDREKEALYWTLYDNAKETECCETQFETLCDISPKLDVASLSYSTLMEMNMDEHLTVTDDGFEINNEINLSKQEKHSLEFENYMQNLFENYERIKRISGRARSFEDIPNSSEDYSNISSVFVSKSAKLPSHVSVDWLNLVLGRLCYDILTQKYWADNIKGRIQKKLDKIEMPSFIDSLTVSDVFLGTSLPQIHTVSDPTSDNFGFWFDFDFNYSGSFQMTLQTKLKISRPKQVPGAETVDGNDPKQNFNTSDISDEEETDEMKTSSGRKKKIFDRIEKWISHRHFQTVAQSRFVKRYVGDISNMPLTLTVEVNALHGVLALNLPPVPSDRIWYGFRKDPVLSLTAYPKVGTHEINLSAIVQLIEKKLIQEFKKALVLPNMDDFLIPIMYSSPIY